MAKALYLEDSYLKEFSAIVVKVEGNNIILDQTAFYPKSGGQPHDTGIIRYNGLDYNVVYVGKYDNEISHEVAEAGLKEGDKVECKINWERRYSHMKAHTAAHILAEALYRNCGALTTGNQLAADECRIDSNFEYSAELIEKTFSLANEMVVKNLPITVQFMPREEAEKLPKMTKLAKGLPEEIKEVRIVSIGDFDQQADGGTHVKSTGEIQKIEFLRYNSKGKDNKRVYFKVL